MDQLTTKSVLPKHRATVIALSRHRSIVEAYERTIAQLRVRAVRTGENFNAQKRTLNNEIDTLGTRCDQLSSRLEAAESHQCSLFWGVLWFFAGAVASLIGLVCLSFAVWP